MDMSVRLAHSYFDMLKSLGNETKLHLIKMLTDSLLKSEAERRAISCHWTNERLFT